MTVDPALLSRALVGSVPVHLSDLITNEVLAADAVVHDAAPPWLYEEVANYRVRLYREAPGLWFLGPLDE